MPCDVPIVMHIQRAVAVAVEVLLLQYVFHGWHGDERGWNRGKKEGESSSSLLLTKAQRDKQPGK